MALGHRDIDIGASRQPYFRGAGRVGAAFAAFEDARRRQQLRAVAHRGNRLAGLVELLDQLQHFFVQAQVFRSTATGDQQGVVIAGLHLGKIEVQGKQMARLFAIGLVALEVVDRRTHGLPGALVGAHRMHVVTDHQQGLERHHHFVVFDVVANQHQDLFRGHGVDSFQGKT